MLRQQVPDTELVQYLISVIHTSYLLIITPTRITIIVIESKTYPGVSHEQSETRL